MLQRIDGRSYPAYRDLRGTWRIGDLELIVDHVQGDPFASPSRVRLRGPTTVSSERVRTRTARIAAEDFLLRRFSAGLEGCSRGSGRSGQLEVLRIGPEIRERSAVRLTEGGVEIRLRAGLPARGRRVLGRQAWEMLCEDLPQAAARLDDLTGLEHHLRTAEDQQALRDQLPGLGLVAFIADGSVLPRASGVETAPLARAVPFQSPPSLRRTLSTPHSGLVSGMGVPEGITLITGGGFHGKSTLLSAVQQGHLDHIHGDGRERVVTVPDAVKIRAEDGRRIEAVDISPLLGELPGGRSTRPFSTDDASGSTSQAAALVEALESGATVLLVDEDTSATNLLVRDERMRALIPANREPITPLVERIRQLHDALGVSTVMVVGGVGDLLSVADHVVGMVDWQAEDWTERARSLAPDPPTAPGPWRPAPIRRVQRDSLRPGKIRAFDTHRLRYGDTELDLSGLEQILDVSCVSTLGEALRFVHEHLADDHRSVAMLLAAFEAIVDDEGIEALSPREYPDGALVRLRTHEVAAALNRLRTLRITVPEEASG